MPSDSSLSKALFSGSGKFGKKRITFRTVHSVSGEYCGREVEGSAPILYNIDRVNHEAKGWKLASDLDLSCDVPQVGAFNDDFLKAALDKVRVKQAYDITSTKDSLFDMRSFCYVLGAAGAVGCSGADPLRGLQAADVHTLSQTYNSPASGEVFVGPKIARDGGETTTLLKLLKMAGVEKATFLTDNVCIGNYTSLTGKKLTAYVMYLFSNVLHLANHNAVACHHLLAFYRGLHSGLHLNAHSDEGGWVRRALRRATYPPSLGLVRVNTGELCGMPATAPPTPEGGVGLLFACYLELSGLWAVSGLNEDGVASTYRPAAVGVNKPSSFIGLQDELYDVASKFRSIVTAEYGFHKCAVGDGHSFRKYFTADAVDSHLSGETIIPFWYVEPSGLVSSRHSGCVAIHGEDTNLPFIKDAEVYKPENGVVVNERPVGGSSVYVKHGAGNLRGNAMSYLMSATYSTRNGLSQVEYEARADLLTATTDALFVPTGVTNGAQRRWVTPHNPLPGSNEAFSTLPLTFEYVYRGYGKEPSLTDWVRSGYHSNVGTLTLDCVNDAVVSVTHRDVPKHIQRWISAQRHAPVTLRSGALKRVVDPVNPPAPPSSFMLPEVETEPGVPDAAPGEPVEPAFNPGPPPDDDPGDPTQVLLTSDAGRRPRDESG